MEKRKIFIMTMMVANTALPKLAEAVTCTTSASNTKCVVCNPTNLACTEGTKYCSCNANSGNNYSCGCSVKCCGTDYDGNATGTNYGSGAYTKNGKVDCNTKTYPNQHANDKDTGTLTTNGTCPAGQTATTLHSHPAANTAGARKYVCTQ